VTDAELIAELAWLVEWSRCKFTDPKMRADWIVRKQRALAEVKGGARASGG
jgi:hypothetical protein